MFTRHRGWVLAGLAVVALATISALAPLGDDTPSAEHCLTTTPFTTQRSAAFERAALNYLRARNAIPAYGYGTIRPRFTHHSLTTGGTKRGEYSLTVTLHDDGKLNTYIGGYHVYGRLNPDTCRATIQGASGRT